ncbi:MAG: hypothetical protein VX730_07960 [Pseudomonadota bacterium]|nr:hypothetical protein [Pseudomonadota bacterium]
MKLSGIALEEYIVASIEKQLCYYFVSDTRAYKLAAQNTQENVPVNEDDLLPVTLEEWQFLCKIISDGRAHLNSNWKLSLMKEQGATFYQILEASALDRPETPPPASPTALSNDEIMLLKAMTGAGPRVRHFPAGQHVKRGCIKEYYAAEDAGEDTSHLMEDHDAYSTSEHMNACCLIHKWRDNKPYHGVWFAGDWGVELDFDENEMVILQSLIDKGVVTLGEKTPYYHLEAQSIFSFWTADD